MFYRQLVSTAAQALDVHEGHAHWALRVDPTRLDARDYGRCPLGQLYGDYLGHDAYQFRRYQPDEVLRAFGGGNLPLPRWTPLTWAWRREITRRRRALERAGVDSNVVAANATSDRREWMS